MNVVEYYFSFIAYEQNTCLLLLPLIMNLILHHSCTSLLSSRMILYFTHFFPLLTIYFWFPPKWSVFYCIIFKAASHDDTNARTDGYVRALKYPKLAEEGGRRHLGFNLNEDFSPCVCAGMVHTCGESTRKWKNFHFLRRHLRL